MIIRFQGSGDISYQDCPVSRSMRIAPLVGLGFVALAMIFFGLWLKDYLKGEGRIPLARKAWLRIALIFAGVGVGLLFMQAFL